MQAADPGHKVSSFTGSTDNIRRHFMDFHMAQWVHCCDDMKNKITAKNAVPRVATFRQDEGKPAPDIKAEEGVPRREFSREGFVDAIVEWIVADDQVRIFFIIYIIINVPQSLNVIENEKLRAIFLMLRSELRDEDIPKRTTLRKRVEEVFAEYLEKLESDMHKVRIFSAKKSE